MRLSFRLARVFLAGLVLGGLAGFLVRTLWPPDQVIEGAAAAERLPSGADLLERNPTASVPSEIRQAVHEAGGKLERAVSIMVRSLPAPAPAEPSIASPPASRGEAAPAQPCSCAPVTVDLGLVRLPDQTRRVIARARDGELLAGLDIPVESLPTTQEAKWGAMAIYMPTEKSGAVLVERDVWRGRIAAGAMLYHGKVVPMIGAGFKF